VAPSGMSDYRPQCMLTRLRDKQLTAIGGLVRNASGVTALEYAFIAGLVAIAIVTVVTTLGTTVSGVLYGAILSGF
jgi:Flp pilus assembly pilin Flp